MTVGPGSTIGIVGGGQLGRMIALAAAQLGYRCHIFDPHEAPAAAGVSAHFTRARFNDEDALRQFAKTCDVITYEFENLAVGPLRALGGKLRPGVASLELSQNRVLEKDFIEQCGAMLAPWRTIDGPGDIVAALNSLGSPILIKSRRFGYDGKGQAWVAVAGEAEAAWAAIGQAPAVAEARINFAAEFSVIIARGLDGATSAFPVPRNSHEDGILRHSAVPAGAPIDALVSEGVAIAGRIVERLGHVGVLTVEFFAVDKGPMVNEFAPRVHNSGHWTIEGAQTSQFEQHVRAICGLPLGATGLVAGGATMDNLIGSDVERWPELIAEPGAHLHLYGKGEARPGRKMGHVTRLRA